MPDSEQKKCNVCRVRFLCQTSEESICDGFGIEVIERAHGLCSDCEYDRRGRECCWGGGDEIKQKFRCYVGVQGGKPHDIVVLLQQLGIGRIYD
jgi:hypothetical protein